MNHVHIPLVYAYAYRPAVIVRNVAIDMAFHPNKKIRVVAIGT